jgi:hypothetical protein
MKTENGNVRSILVGICDVRVINFFLQSGFQCSKGLLLFLEQFLHFLKLGECILCGDVARFDIGRSCSCSRLFVAGVLLELFTSIVGMSFLPTFMACFIGPILFVIVLGRFICLLGSSSPLDKGTSFRYCSRMDYSLRVSLKIPIDSVSCFGIDSSTGFIVGSFCVVVSEVPF